MKRTKQGVQNRDANAANRAALAVSLRARKLTYEQIARQCGYGSAAACYNAVQRELQRTVNQNVDELRREELDILNRLHAAIWPLAVCEIGCYPDGLAKDDEEEDGGEKKKKRKGPSLYAVDRVLAISERRAKLMGLDVLRESNVAANLVVVREVPNSYLGEPQQ